VEGGGLGGGWGLGVGGWGLGVGGSVRAWGVAVEVGLESPCLNVSGCAVSVFLLLCGAWGTRFVELSYRQHTSLTQCGVTASTQA
jgi:hypothetical protein